MVRAVAPSFGPLHISVPLPYPQHFQVIPGKGKGAINSMTWTYDPVATAWRLFSAGLDGLLVEWDLRHLRPLCASASLGGAAWDIAAQPRPANSAPGADSNAAAGGAVALGAPDDGEDGGSRGGGGDDVLVAVATDDGAVRLLVAEGGGRGLEFRRTLGRSDSRALSLAWHPCGHTVYAGFADGSIRAMDMATGALAPRRRQLQLSGCLADGLAD
jgi:WD40 repeat protein